MRETTASQADDLYERVSECAANGVSMILTSRLTRLLESSIPQSCCR
jgi:hypothetical protein